MAISTLLQTILSKRNIINIDEFLNPLHPRDIPLSDLHIDEKEMKKALALIKKYAHGKQPIVIYGDYDADGITSTAILWEMLHYSGINAMPFIPHRQDHGYGLSIAGIDEVMKIHHPSLIITVDNGITALEATKYAQKKGIKVIITDHHQRGKAKHPANATIHSLDVAGAGLSWFFAREVKKELNLSRQVDDLLELAAIGTITDLVPLVGINRSVAKYGIEQIKCTDRKGLQELVRIAGIDPLVVDSYHLGFHLGPRLNAMGRLEYAMDSLRLLCTNKSDQAQELAKLLNDTNRKRQELTDQMTEIAIGIAKNQKDNPAIIVSHKDFHEGIVGLIAGKLVQKYWRPAIVLAENGDMYKASARSIPGFNIIETIRRTEHLLESAGGHPMAAGFNIKMKKLEQFTKEFLKLAQLHLTPEMLERKVDIDATTEFGDLQSDVWDNFEHLAPFGIGNSKPLLASENVLVVDAKVVGKEGQHLKVHLKQHGVEFSAVGFGMGAWMEQLLPHTPANIAYHLNKNVWNGRTSLELQLKAIQPLE